MHTSPYVYQHQDQQLQGHLAYNDTFSNPRPAILIAPDWSGCNAFAIEKAEAIAKLGYLGFAIDIYGSGREGKTVEEKTALMQPFVTDRSFLRARMQAALDALMAIPKVDKSRIAAIGFCFGGLCVLDLARAGADIQGVVSFHGLLHKPQTIPNQSIKAKILALHGHEDPMVSQSEVQAFCTEMQESKVDWQLHQYGNTLHAFTNPEVKDYQMGTVYNSVASLRSWRIMQDFLQELFA